MKKAKWSFVVVLFLFATACGTTDTKNEDKKEPVQKTKEDYSNEITSLEKKMFAVPQMDVAVANDALKDYSEFANLFPTDPKSPDYLFKAAQIQTNIKQYQQAAVTYQTILDKYPDFKYSVDCMYLMAHLYDDNINNEPKAKAIYELLIQKYPNHHYAEEAKICIKNLGKSDEEIIKEFEKKNKGK